MKRLFLFLTTNAMVLVALSIMFRVFGVAQWLYRQGVAIGVQELLISFVLFGMWGSSSRLSRPFMSRPPQEARIAVLQHMTAGWEVLRYGH